VSTVTGDTKYFFLALDDHGDVVGGSGSSDWPHLATIVGKLPDGAQSIDGEAVPLRCHDVADCPPDFPGCPPYQVRRAECRSDFDCKKGDRCAWDGYCGSPTSQPHHAVLSERARANGHPRQGRQGRRRRALLRSAGSDRQARQTFRRHR
jgi:hypothetical protein